LRDVTGKAVDGAQRVKRTKALKEVEKVGIITLQVKFIIFRQIAIIYIILTLL
jgi:hypothetical protein